MEHSENGDMTRTGNQIDEEASRWAVRLASGPLPVSTAHELEEWMAADPRHHGALIRARAVWVDLDRLAALSRGARNQKTSSEWRQLARPRLVAVSIALLIIAGIGGWMALHAARGKTYFTEIGESRDIKLADGSNMALNTATTAVVRFTGAQREINLTRGEALFEVTKDPARPFIVHAGDLTVRAVGTAFAVRRDEDRVNVTVTEGVVEVTRKDGTKTQEGARRVVANQRAVATEAQPVSVQPIAVEDAERQLAWRGGMVAFDGEPVIDAVKEINRHSVRHIIVEDSTLAQRPVIGIFHANDIDTFADASAIALGAEAVRDGDVIRLRARSRH